MARLACFFLLTSITAISGSFYNVAKPTEWWQRSVLYQIWLRSFKDSNGDGIGDLNGITSQMEHFADMGVGAVWISPFYTSPLVDSGYDIKNYTDTNPLYGTLEDFDNLVARAKEFGIKIVIDFVPNHTSDQHEWFVKSKAGIEPYTDYYVWNEGIIVNGRRQPPNNWLCVFDTGSAWQWEEERQAYYLHQFSYEQPDLNLTNPLVIQETKDILTFWLDRGIDGWRFDAMPYLIESAGFENEPAYNNYSRSETGFYHLWHILVKDRLENYDLVKLWVDHVANYTNTNGNDKVRAVYSEALANISMVSMYYDYGSMVPFNFFMTADYQGINPANMTTASNVLDSVDVWMTHMPEGATANWVFGNHDIKRVATRLGEERIDGINVLLYMLPGIAVTYMGEEIGMVNADLTWEKTEDPLARATDPIHYTDYSRDPQRTPYQWDNTTSAGFSTNATTMLPVNDNYLTLNLAAQKEADISYYKNVKKLIALRKLKVLREGSLDIRVIDENFLVFARELEGFQSIVVVINWESTPGTVSLESFERLPDYLRVLVADVNSGIKEGDIFEKDNMELPGNAAIVLTGIDDSAQTSHSHRIN